MTKHVRFPLGFALCVMAASAAQARGPLAQAWRVYPAKTMETCRMGTAPAHIAPRCDELLGAYATALQACVPADRGGPVVGERLIAVQTADPDCAAAAAVQAADSVK